MPSHKLTLDHLLRIYLDKSNKVDNEISELEVKFGTRSKKKIAKIDFDNVIKTLLSRGFQIIDEPKNYLRVIIKNTRVEIEGLYNIQQYCKLNSLPSEVPLQGYKFQEKKVYVFEGTEIKGIINYDEFDFRVTYNIEKNMSAESPHIKRLLNDWSEADKFYRLINRHTLRHPDYPVLIDFSVVRESKHNNLRDSNIFNEVCLSRQLVFYTIKLNNNEVIAV